MSGLAQRAKPAKKAIVHPEDREYQNLSTEILRRTVQGKRRRSLCVHSFCERNGFVRLNGGRGTEPCHPWWQEIWRPELHAGIQKSRLGPRRYFPSGYRTGLKYL